MVVGVGGVRFGGRAVLVAAVATLAGCDANLDGTIDFVNQTGQTVWVGHNAAAPDAFRVPDRLWVEVPPGERAVITDGGCLETGELVVATAAEEPAVIDARPLAAPGEGICTGDHWEWSGVGDHE